MGGWVLCQTYLIERVRDEMLRRLFVLLIGMLV